MPPDCAGLIPFCEDSPVPLDIGAIVPDDMPEEAVPPDGAIFPGDASGAGEEVAAFGAPVGAGEVIDV
jgi:hypothetical protein